MIAAVVVAAGRGRRLGGVAKALLRTPKGESFLAAITERAQGAEIRDIVAVIGGAQRAVTEVEAARLGLAVNPAPRRGMASSVALGFSFASGAFSAEAALLWPVDHPSPSAETLARLCRSARASRAVIPAYRGRGGHPVAVGRALWPELASCAGAPEGARSVLRAHAKRVQRIDVDDPGVLRDVDTPADRVALAQAGGLRRAQSR